MKVKDLVDLFDCEVIIEHQSREKVFGNMVEGHTVRYYRGDIEECPDDLLMMDVCSLASEYEDIITVNVYSKLATAYRDCFIKEAAENGEYIKNFISDFIFTHNLLINKGVLVTDEDMKKSFANISRLLKLFCDADVITNEELDVFEAQIIISSH